MKLKKHTMDYNVYRIHQVSSTNTYLQDILKANPGLEETVVSAEYQTDGRGQGSNAWESRPGENILMSWLIYPEFLSVSGQFQLSKIVSLAICDYLNSYIGNLFIKWPNDILAGTRKIAGILIENSVMQETIQNSIIGIGINVNQEFFPGYPLMPTSLFLETGRRYDLDKQIRKLVKSLYKRYHQLRNGKGAEIDRDYLYLLFRYRQRSLFEAGGEQFEGMIHGINAYGQLEVTVSGVIRTYNFREIQLILN